MTSALLCCAPSDTGQLLGFFLAGRFARDEHE